MSKPTMKFIKAINARLEVLAKDLPISGIRTRDEDVIAVARIGGMDETGVNPILTVSHQQGMLRVEIRRLAFLGPGNSVANLAVHNLTHELAEIFCEEGDPTLKDRFFHVIAYEAFTSRRRTVWDLMAMIAMETNKYHLCTRSMVGFLDGEIFVDTTLDCDFKSVPGGFDERVRSLAAHANQLRAILRFVRGTISDEPASADECFRGMAFIHKVLNQSLKTGAANQGNAEGVASQQPEATDTSEEDEEEIMI